MAKAIETIIGATEKRRYSLKAQAEDLAEARKALESAANIARGLWFTFMSLAAGVFITTGTVTHRDLFLETPVKLPLLNAELPMVAFFWVTPLMFLVFHTYLLLNLTFLGDNVRHYFDLVDATGLDIKSKDKLYLQLPNFLAVQVLRERRQTPWTVMGYALHCVLALTVVVGPLVALLFLQVKFLPYHLDWVTQVQRVVIAFDAVAILYFWPLLLGRPASLLVWYIRLLLYAVIAFIALFAAFVAVFPGEPFYRKGPFESSGIADWVFRGEVDFVTGKPESWFSDRLVLANEDFVDLDDEKLGRADKTLSFRGRNLELAILVGTDLRKADFTGANLQGADLRSARLQGAFFSRPAAQGNAKSRSEMRETRLFAANFSDACLNGVNFNQVDMRRATLDGANLDGAKLRDAQVQGASLVGSSLVGADLSYAKLKGAYFSGADLTGAQLLSADLTGSTIFRTRLEDVKLDSAKMNAAIFAENFVLGATDSRGQWNTVFVHGLSDRRELLGSGQPKACGQTLVAGPGAIAALLQPPSDNRPRKAGDIMAAGVQILPENASAVDAARWRERLDVLRTEMCRENAELKNRANPDKTKKLDQKTKVERDTARGALEVEKLAAEDILRRTISPPTFRSNPNMHLGPLSPKELKEFVESPGCPKLSPLPADMAGELECWLLPAGTIRQECINSSHVNAALP